MIANALKRFNRFSSDVRLFIACQFALESDFGHSSLCARNCNHSGMKVPRRRLTTAINIDVPLDTFAKYVSLSDCVLDYVLWCQFARIGLDAQADVPSFITFLNDNKYCHDKGYTDRILSIFNQFK